tara:strand:- start:27 stop:542 length:516 start_codon:yes stop_codon:yes gene_type:complete
VEKERLGGGISNMTSYYQHRYNTDPKFKAKERARCNTYAQSEQGRKIKFEWYKQSRNTEKGYLDDKWNSIKKGGRKKLPVEFTKKEFLQKWEEHKIKYGGWICGYTGLPMTKIRGTGKGKPTPSNMSADRIDSSRGYTKDNMIFCRWDFNNRKGDMTIEDMKNVLKVINEN